MLYRPKYCCNCGEKISRAEWRLLTSRRFCELCETEYKGEDYVPRAIVAIGLVLSIFGFRGMIGQPEAPAAVSATSAPKTTLKSESAPVRQQTAPPQNATQAATALPESSLLKAKTIEQPVSNAKTSEQSTYFCGALTKKGTPCSRRVKTKGTRCWQHSL